MRSMFIAGVIIGSVVDARRVLLMRAFGMVSACVLTVVLLGAAAGRGPSSRAESAEQGVASRHGLGQVESWTSDAATTTAAPGPKITYVQTPTLDAALPLSVSVPTQVRVGQVFTATAQCTLSWAGTDAQFSVYSTREANPPQATIAGGIERVTSATPPVDAEGRFSTTFRASPWPQVVYLMTSCGAEMWISDALVPDGEGGYLVSYSYYPPDRLVAIEIVAGSDPGGTLPPSL